MLRSLAGGSLLLPGIISELLAGASAGASVARAPHFQPRARRVIFIYLSGGVSHVDSFDPKPKLYEAHGAEIPPYAGAAKNQFAKRPDWKFRAWGRCGTTATELFPQIASCLDDIAVIRSMKGDHGNHFEATLGIHTGSVTFARPSMGSWVSYGLGTENRNLPSFIVLAPFLPYAGGQVWSSDFLPAEHQGVRVVGGTEPIPHLKRPQEIDGLQELELGLLRAFNRRHLKARATDPVLAARIRSFETAFGMQMEAPEAFDISNESDATLRLYGLAREARQGFGWQCLVARRLAERGVRFIELIDTGSNQNWDSHGDMADHGRLARAVDQPIAGLLRDLKLRGMLEDTLVVWTTEFGRTPTVEKPDNKGREHHARVFSSWLAGGGVKGGITYGESDEFGREVARDQCHVHDFHATILHLLGMDHTRLTYRHGGRDFRLTDIAGEVVKGLLA
jgi:hypothetical protein